MYVCFYLQSSDPYSAYGSQYYAASHDVGGDDQYGNYYGAYSGYEVDDNSYGMSSLDAYNEIAYARDNKGARNCGACDTDDEEDQSGSEEIKQLKRQLKKRRKELSPGRYDSPCDSLSSAHGKGRYGSPVAQYDSLSVDQEMEDEHGMGERRKALKNKRLVLV